ncbi:MAG: hypothetical protein KJZ70_10365 [Bryobacterales bacterium]|nr:hypothetical protein [Bryobacterales bacterium]
MTTPTWLPPIVSVNGDPTSVFQMLYGIFDADFRRKNPRFQNMPIWWDRRVVEPPYEEGFWHLITRLDYPSGERLLDPRRAEKLPWCGPTIENCKDACLKVWDYLESNGRTRTYLWLHGFDYVVILERAIKRIGLVVFLVTAFHVDGKQKREDLERKYQKRVA